MSTDTQDSIPMVQVARERLQTIDTKIAEVDVLVGELLTTIGRWEDHHSTVQKDLGFAQGEVARLRAELENRPTPDRSESESLKAKVAQLERAIALKDVQLGEEKERVKSLMVELADFRDTDVEGGA